MQNEMSFENATLITGSPNGFAVMVFDDALIDIVSNHAFEELNSETQKLGVGEIRVSSQKFLVNGPSASAIVFGDAAFAWVVAEVLAFNLDGDTLEEYTVSKLD